MYIYIYIYIYIYPFIYPSICASIHSSIHSAIHASIIYLHVALYLVFIVPGPQWLGPYIVHALGSLDHLTRIVWPWEPVPPSERHIYNHNYVHLLCL